MHSTAAYQPYMSTLGPASIASALGLRARRQGCYHGKSAFLEIRFGMARLERDMLHTIDHFMLTRHPPGGCVYDNFGPILKAVSLFSARVAR